MLPSVEHRSGDRGAGGDRSRRTTRAECARERESRRKILKKARATIRYAEDQSLAALGLAHPADGRENATDAPLRPLAGRGLELGSRDAFTQGVRYVNS